MVCDNNTNVSQAIKLYLKWLNSTFSYLFLLQKQNQKPPHNNNKQPSQKKQKNERHPQYLPIPILMNKIVI